MKSIQDLDAVVKRQDFTQSISSVCQIASLIHDQLVSDKVHSLSDISSKLCVSASSCISRILMKLGKLIVAIVVLNSEWSVLDSKDNARYQAGQVSLSLKSFQKMEITEVSPESSKVSGNVFHALLIESITSELRNGSEFLSNQIFQSLSKLNELSGLSESAVFAKIAVFIQSLGIFISYAEIVDKLFDKNISQQTDLIHQKIVNCIKFIKGRETTDSQKKIRLIPNSVVKINSLIQDIVDAFRTLLNQKMINPLKFYERISSMKSNPSSAGLRDLYLSCLDWAGQANSNDIADIILSRFKVDSASITATSITEDKKDNFTKVRLC
jgi:hypothetical protein